MLVGENLTKTVESKTILDNASLCVTPGTAIAIIGPNGAGKTVLLHALSLIDPPTEGLVAIDDTEYQFPGAEMSETPWPTVTVVFQQFHLWPHMTLQDNILLPMKRNGASRYREGSFDDLVSRFRLTEVLKRYPNEASVGERQRTALARALICRPKFLLLDEVTSAQDIEHVQNMLTFFRQLKAEGVALLFVTHLLGFAGQLADEILFMDRGSIVERGNRSILSSPQSDRMKHFVSMMECLH